MELNTGRLPAAAQSAASIIVNGQEHKLGPAPRSDPAVANAIAAATGRRLRALPLIPAGRLP